MSAARPALWSVCVLGSALLHLGVLWSPVARVGGRPDTPTHPPPASARVLAVRLVPARPQPPPTTAPVTATPEVIDLDPFDTLPPPAAGPSTLHPATEAPEPEPPYLPRSQLSRGPSPQQTIDLPYPDLAPVGRFRAVLTLFIDEQGVVRRVRIDEADDTGLPPLLEDTARQTFLQSAFTPGEIEGRPVRSQLRIEVEFATESLVATPATAAR